MEDDISLISSRQRDMQEKTEVGSESDHQKKKLMKMNHKSNNPVTINNSDIDDVNELTYPYSRRNVIVCKKLRKYGG